MLSQEVLNNQKLVTDTYQAIHSLLYDKVDVKVLNEVMVRVATIAMSVLETPNAEVIDELVNKSTTYAISAMLDEIVNVCKKE